ncbi:hypothetical protein OEZ85_013487 [Tetradesmus obliquus]|uniref:Trimeric autotransporter adhesin YadA-like head domain-containing protein n=1 Tax=Tetradesmus obliquus TaxID=3088 RepID=A0ABY8UQU9_TETOB|nr:hypothetical protein OEZ85_013487 [Tetradesmus obliquus]
MPRCNVQRWQDAKDCWRCCVALISILLVCTPGLHARRLAQAPWEFDPAAPQQPVIPVDANNKSVTVTTRFDTRLPDYKQGDVFVRFDTPDEPTHIKGVDYGATTAIADNTVISTVDYAYDYSVGAKLQTDVSAEAGQGVAVALGRAHGDSKQGSTLSRVKSTAYASRWYMAPGHAISGIANIGRGGRAASYNWNRARASLGSATAGVLAKNLGTGDFIGGNTVGAGGAFTDGDYGATGTLLDNRANTAAGNAAAGYLNLNRAYLEDALAANDPGASAATAVGNAVAGGITIAIADEGAAFIGE